MLEIIAAEGSGRYIIPLSDLVKSVLLGDGEYYDPSRSPIGNLFDISSASRSEHFILPILIEHLQSQGSTSSSDGYVSGEDVYGFAQGLGFAIDAIAGALTRGLQARFIGRAGFDRRRGDDARAYRVTPCGLYATRRLAHSFAYIDAMIDDTPIGDATLFSTLHPMSHDRDLPARLRRAERFAEYLNEAWGTLGVRASELPFDWRAARVSIADDVRRIGERVRR